MTELRWGMFCLLSHVALWICPEPYRSVVAADYAKMAQARKNPKEK
ncbi:MAG: hypothetical protein ACK4HD_07390 [Pannonibacter phragmitetus]